MTSGQNWTYDLAGNVIGDPDGRTFTYDGENKQTEVKNSQQQTTGQYFFDGDGRRVKKIVSATGETTVFVYDAGGKLVAEYSTIVASTNDARVAYLTNDHLGSPRITTDALGQVISRRDFQPYGEEIFSPQRTAGLNYTADTIRQKFTGYQKDNETQLDFAEARMYENRFGRFTAIDPLMVSAKAENPQTWNRYIYVINNPLVMIDPSEEMGDYYDRDDGSYLGNDGKDDHKVYSGKELSRTEKDGKIYRQVGDVRDLRILDEEFNTISNIIRQEGATNDANEYLWIAHTTNNCVQTNCQKMPSRTMSGLLSTRYSTVANSDKTELSPEDGSLKANAARAAVINVLSGGADPTGGATFWDGTDFLLRGRSQPKFSQYDSIAIRNDVFNSYVGSQGGSSFRLNGRRYANPNPFFNQNKGSWNRDGEPESGFLYRRNSGRGILYATGTAGKSIFWTTNYKWNK